MSAAIENSYMAVLIRRTLLTDSSPYYSYTYTCVRLLWFILIHMYHVARAFDEFTNEFNQHNGEKLHFNSIELLWLLDCSWINATASIRVKLLLIAFYNACRIDYFDRKNFVFCYCSHWQWIWMITSFKRMKITKHTEKQNA